MLGPGCRPTQAIALPERLRAPRPQPGPPEAAREGDGPDQRGPAPRSRLVRAPPHFSLPACPAPERAVEPGPGSPASPASMGAPRAARSRPAPRPPGAPAPPPLRLPCPSSRWTHRPAQAAAAGEEGEEAALRLRPTPGTRGGAGARGGKGRGALRGCARGWVRARGAGLEQAWRDSRHKELGWRARACAWQGCGGGARGLEWLVAETRSPRLCRRGGG